MGLALGWGNHCASCKFTLTASASSCTQFQINFMWLMNNKKQWLKFCLWSLCVHIHILGLTYVFHLQFQKICSSMITKMAFCRSCMSSYFACYSWCIFICLFMWNSGLVKFVPYINTISVSEKLAPVEPFEFSSRKFCALWWNLILLRDFLDYHF